jgi:predicted DsbA family dithiol-disulfide isomerase
MFAESGFAYAPHPEITPNTQLALELGELARGEGLHAAYHEAVMQAMWEQERNVADPDVIRAVAIGVGLDAEAVDEAIASRRFRTVVQESTREAHAMGINVVPAFVLQERYLLLGAQPHDVFEQVIRENGLA